MREKKDFHQRDLLDNVVKGVLWTLGVGFVFLIFLTLFQCSLRKPTSPTWETDLIVPLINKTYDMVTIIEEADEPSLYVDSVGQLRFLKEIDLDTTRMEKLLTFAPSSHQIKENLGILKIEAPEPQETEFALSQVYQGEVGLIPPFSFTLNKELDSVSTFSTAVLDEGKAYVLADNHLGLDLDSLSIDVIDDHSSQVIEKLIFPEGLKDGQIDTQEVGLNGKTVSNHISYDIQAHTPGGTILSLSGKYLRLGFSFCDSLLIREAFAQIPQIQIERTQSSEIPTDDVIQRAVVKTGSLVLDISNHTNLSANLEIRVPAFSHQGVPISVNRFVSPGSNIAVEIPLGDCLFQPEWGRQIYVYLNGTTQSTGSEKVWVSSSDSMVVQADLTQLYFTEVTEIVQPTFVEITTIEKDVDLPQGFDAAHLPEASLSLEIANGVQLPGQLNIQLTGDAGQNLNLSVEVEAGSPSDPVKGTLIESDLTQFLNPIPCHVTVTGDVGFGDGATSTTITQEDFVVGRIIISSPLELILDSTQIKIDEGEDSLDEDERELVQERLLHTKIVSQFENHLPLSARVELYLKTTPEVYTQPDLLIGPVELVSGEIDQAGNVIAPTLCQNVVQLDKEKLKIFESAPFFVGGRIVLPGSNGKKVKFKASDYIKVSSYLEVKMRAGE